MIAVTDLHGRSIVVNAELIESVQANPDTQIVLLNGHRYYVRESPDEVVRRVIAYRRQTGAPPIRPPLPAEGEPAPRASDTA